MEEKILNAEKEFRKTIQQQLNELRMGRGLSHERAVETLFARMKGDKVVPEEKEIVQLAEVNGITRAEALRVLMIRNELRVMKDKGLDSLAAIENLTKKLAIGGKKKEKKVTRSKHIRRRKQCRRLLQGAECTPSL